MTWFAIGLLALLLPVVVHDLIRRPIIRRLALGNVVRHRHEAAMVVGGAALAGALITSSFLIADSFRSSIRDLAADAWGPTDELVAVADPADADALAATLDPTNEPDIDGVIAARGHELAVATVGPDRRVEPRVDAVALDRTAAATFGGETDSTGLDGVAVADDQAVVTRRLADELALAVGDSLVLHTAAGEIDTSVGAIVEARGLAGRADLVLSPDLIDDVGRPMVLVSNTGDLFTGADRTDAATSRLAEAAAAIGVRIDVDPVKADHLAEADEEAAWAGSMFGTIGGFSVAAAVLLIVNLFVMLAAERRTELGTLRALGLGRGVVLRAFAAEGAVYSTLAALVGAAAGVGLAGAVMALAERFLTDGELALSLAVTAPSLVSGVAIGLAISLATAVLTSWRLTGFGIVAALKDLPDGRHRHPRTALVAGTTAVAAGGAALILAPEVAAVAMAAPIVVALGTIPVLGRVVGARVATVVAAVGGIGWAAAVFGLLPDTMADPDVGLFLLQGLLLVGLGVTVAAAADRWWLQGARRLAGGDPAVGLGLAHPLAKPTRTALLVAMYALVIFTVTFLSVMTSVFTASTPELARQAAGANDLVVEVNEGAGVTADELEGLDGVVDASPVRRTFATIVDDEGETAALVSILDADFDRIAPADLGERADRFATDEEAWAAVLRPTDEQRWIIVDDDSPWALDEQVVIASATGETAPVHIAGRSRHNWLLRAGQYVGPDLAADLIPSGSSPDRFFVDVADGADAEALADRIDADFLTRGAEARSVLGVAEDAMAGDRAFMAILQGYLGLGLLIGIAGLSVVLVRAVRERRRQIGMLRAIGIPTATVQRTFWIEAAFVGLQGIALGVGLGVVSSWQALTRSTAFEEGLTFRLPAAELGLLAAGCLVAAVGAAAWPAWRSRSITPAAALRLTG